tara:strand:- start:439 stop:807 length:369 start_codon:yes stop_codon:yes gene_type:complete
MATIASQNITEAGLSPTMSDAGGDGDQFENTGAEFLLITNTSGGSIVVTITAQTTTVEDRRMGELTKANSTITIANGASGLIGYFQIAAYSDTDGYVQITYSETEEVTIAVLTCIDPAFVAE